MTRAPSLSTERLTLRPWRTADRGPFAALNADPEVMAHLPALLDREEADAMVDAMQAELEAEGFGLWAVEVRAGAPLIGFVGLHRVQFDAPFTPAVEIGWRLARAHWGHGYVTEAGRACLTFAFDEVGLDEVVSFTVAANTRSTAVMERLGMTHDPADDFDHPRLPPGHRLRRHVLYRLRRADRARAGV